jgi:hypothetical protein
VVTYGAEPSAYSSQGTLVVTSAADRSTTAPLTANGSLTASGRRTRVAAASIGGNAGFNLVIPTGFEELGFAALSANGTLIVNGSDVTFQEFEQTTISKRADLLDALFRRLDSRVETILYKHQDAIFFYSSSAIGLDNEGILRVYATVDTNFVTDIVSITPLDIATLTQPQLDEWPQIVIP